MAGNSASPGMAANPVISAKIVRKAARTVGSRVKMFVTTSPVNSGMMHHALYAKVLFVQMGVKAVSSAARSGTQRVSSNVSSVWQSA